MKLTKDNVEEWLKYRQENKLPHPPLQGNKIRFAGIWWLVQYGEDVGSGLVHFEPVLMQWSPFYLKWQKQGDLATNQPYYDMQGYRVLKEIEYPVVPNRDELIELSVSRRSS